ncbi:unnamed protein product, partial [marine sediment metagenome]
GNPGANLTFKAQEKAKENAGRFIEKIGLKVKALEDDYTIPKERIENAQEQPDFSALLQKSIISAAQTESENKHDILSRLITKRLQTENESLLALSSRIACDVVIRISLDRSLLTNNSRFFHLPFSVFCFYHLFQLLQSGNRTLYK